MKNHIIRNLWTKFQVDWTSTSPKTTSTKNINLKWDRRTNRQTNRRTEAQTRKHNGHKWGIKMLKCMKENKFDRMY